MAVSRVRLSSLLLLVVFFCICSDLGLGHQSPASHHSCSHDHHHHHHHDDSSVSHHDHNHDHHHSHDEAKGKTKKKMLPEELAEEEDLKLYGFGSGSDHHDDHDHDPSHGGSQLSGVGSYIENHGKIVATRGSHSAVSEHPPRAATLVSEPSNMIPEIVNSQAGQHAE
ncbi:hypothetical protein Cgig2_016498 [Carnegiea gigantea]|uniref:Uncharacterized protein n=1 Tax=Carnegiea gigantea TaxID=171969 RepID=A0A9Q1GZJ9_9CARY|nr:hypothetical protein Cgig2_016498 [Carnegiea gigantea]